MLYRFTPGMLGDAELKQALLVGKSQSCAPPHVSSQEGGCEVTLPDM